MSGFASAFKEEGRKEGIEKGMEKAVIQFVLDRDISLGKGAQKLGVSEETLLEKIKEYKISLIDE